MGGCPPDWMLFVGVLRISGTLLYSKRHIPNFGLCLLLYRRVPVILRTLNNSIQSVGQTPINHSPKERIC